MYNRDRSQRKARRCNRDRSQRKAGRCNRERDHRERQGDVIEREIIEKDRYI